MCNCFNCFWKPIFLSLNPSLRFQLPIQHNSTQCNFAACRFHAWLSIFIQKDIITFSQRDYTCSNKFRIIMTLQNLKVPHECQEWKQVSEIYFCKFSSFIRRRGMRKRPFSSAFWTWKSCATSMQPLQVMFTNYHPTFPFFIKRTCTSMLSSQISQVAN